MIRFIGMQEPKSSEYAVATAVQLYVKNEQLLALGSPGITHGEVLDTLLESMNISYERVSLQDGTMCAKPQGENYSVVGEGNATIFLNRIHLSGKTKECNKAIHEEHAHTLKHPLYTFSSDK